MRRQKKINSSLTLLGMLMLASVGAHATGTAAAPNTVQLGAISAPQSHNFADTGGSYSGVMNVAPVSEPKSYALMLTGIGVLALAIGRKKKTAS